MSQNHLMTNLSQADQSVKNFIADLLEELNTLSKSKTEPCIHMEYFGAVMEIRLLAFGEQKIRSSQAI
ncbi:hypothetical protein [Vibrio aerogenes]|uniref:hypothetical protein n=1 Tax=Vibrio aerogenes TaxID=92172 RepID=UPI0021C4876A|nr:hypothetical protein [Vibrio aerogenes]